MNRTLKHVIIDGIHFHVDDFSTDIVTYSHETIQSYIAQGKPNAKITIRLNETKFTAPIDGMEIKGDTIYVYGPLRNFLPSLYADKILLAWQIAYLKTGKNYRELDEYTVWRDDARFTTLPAEYFKQGYEAALLTEAVKVTY